MGHHLWAKVWYQHKGSAPSPSSGITHQPSKTPCRGFRAPAFILPFGRASLTYLPWRGLRFGALSVLRGTSGGETMTTPGAAGTTPPPGVVQGYSCSAHRLLSWVGAPTVQGSDPSLCPTPNTRESSHLAYKDTPGGVHA